MLVKYKDDLELGWVNGYYVGKKQGTKTRDILNMEDDGYDYLRESVHFGTVMQDAENPNFPELEDDEDNGNGEGNGDGGNGDDGDEGGDD